MNPDRAQIAALGADPSPSRSDRIPVQIPCQFIRAMLGATEGQEREVLNARLDQIRRAQGFRTNGEALVWALKGGNDVPRY